MNYSIIDVETTGFSPLRGDKIIEVGIVKINSSGQIIEKYDSLINPNRDLGATSVHGITGDMVMDAPVFKQVSDDILSVLNNSIIVAHNARFDLSFLNNELSVSGFDQFSLNAICTLQLARITEPDLHNYKLKTLCEYLDIELKEQHAAIYDSMATSQIFQMLKESFIRKHGEHKYTQRFEKGSLTVLKNTLLNPSGLNLNRQKFKADSRRNQSKLANLINRLPLKSSGKSEHHINEYINVLDEILEDRIVTNEESLRLDNLYREYGISNNEATLIHNTYLSKLIRLYLLDDIITTVELKDLQKVRNLLGVQTDLDRLISEIRETNTTNTLESNIGHQELVGKSVCFTGQLNCTFHGDLINRAVAQELATENGLIIKSGVSKNLNFLVVADPNSQSGKAKKARSLGVKIIAEVVFWNMLGIEIE